MCVRRTRHSDFKRASFPSRTGFIARPKRRIHGWLDRLHAASQSTASVCHLTDHARRLKRQLTDYRQKDFRVQHGEGSGSTATATKGRRKAGKATRLKGAHRLSR